MALGPRCPMKLIRCRPADIPCERFGQPRGSPSGTTGMCPIEDARTTRGPALNDRFHRLRLPDVFVRRGTRLTIGKTYLTGAMRGRQPLADGAPEGAPSQPRTRSIVPNNPPPPAQHRRSATLCRQGPGGRRQSWRHPSAVPSYPTGRTTPCRIKERSSSRKKSVVSSPSSLAIGRTGSWPVKAFSAVPGSVELSSIPLAVRPVEEDDRKSSIPGCCRFATICGLAFGRSYEPVRPSAVMNPVVPYSRAPVL
jgi:hypothetical protein